MSRLGCAILLVIVLAAAAFFSLLRFGDGSAPPRATVSSPVPPAATPAGLLAVPVAGVPRSAIIDSWGDARAEGREHHGTDIAAPKGTPVLAAASGTIEKLYQDARGGTTIYERSPDRLLTFYYAHLSGYAPGLHEGQQVRAGERLGFVGDTGDAGEGNYHLHFGLTRTTPDQRWYQGQDVDAYPLLAGKPAPR